MKLMILEMDRIFPVIRFDTLLLKIISTLRLPIKIKKKKTNGLQISLYFIILLEMNRLRIIS